MKQSERPVMEEIRGTLDEILNQIKKLIREGNTRRVIIKNRDGKVLLQSKLTLGVAGTVFLAAYAPLLTAITTIILYVNDVRVFVEKDPDEDEPGNKDEYEVDAEVIDIDNGGDDDDDDAAEKTVGKDREN
jgi:hypothetical protein